MSPVDDVTEAGAEDDSDEDHGANAELERGAEIKSGFLIKKQERRKVRSHSHSRAWRVAILVLGSDTIRCGRRSGSCSVPRASHITRTTG